MSSSRPTITAIIPHYFNQRAPSLLMACDALTRGTVVADEILVWNNDQPLGFTMPGVEVIQSHRNVGPQARFLAALVAKGDLIFFQDNDVAVQPRTLEHLRSFLLETPQQFPIASLEGRRLGTDRKYRTSTWLRPGPTAARADLTLGRGEMAHKLVLHEAIKYFPWVDAPMDDICFSWALAQRAVPIWVVPVGQDAGLTNLKEYGVGSRFDEQHYKMRDALCQSLWPEQVHVE